jgi:hypothetical protein
LRGLNRPEHRGRSVDRGGDILTVFQAWDFDKPRDNMNVSTIKLLGISGSPRIASTDFAAKFALRYAREKYQIDTDYVSVHRKIINFCIHCDFCLKKKRGMHSKR